MSKKKRNVFGDFWLAQKLSFKNPRYSGDISKIFVQNMWYLGVYRPKHKNNSKYLPILSQGSMADLRMGHLVIKTYLVPSHQVGHLGPDGARIYKIDTRGKYN